MCWVQIHPPCHKKSPRLTGASQLFLRTDRKRPHEEFSMSVNSALAPCLATELHEQECPT